jgi:hypothetical protein
VTELRHISVLGAAEGWPAHLRTPNLRYLDLLHSPSLNLPCGPLPHLHFLRLQVLMMCRSASLHPLLRL